MTLLEAWERNVRLEPITVEILREHADLLARSIGATVFFSHTDYARAGLRMVWGPKIVDEAGYCSRLHELGHLETQSAKAKGVTVRLSGSHVANSAGESAAWTWARQHALVWTPQMQDELRRCLASYRRFAKHGAKDRIWLELDRVGDRLTLGYAKHQLDCVGRLRLDDARKLLAKTTR